MKVCKNRTGELTCPVSYVILLKPTRSSPHHLSFHFIIWLFQPGFQIKTLKTYPRQRGADNEQAGRVLRIQKGGCLYMA
jgi:hypothetical protein